MGDRGNIAVEFPTKNGKKPQRIFMYGHYAGADLPEIIRVAIAKRWRWDNAPYLARIIFDVMTAGDRDTELGFAISPGICDNNRPLVVVSTEKQMVSFERIDGSILATMTFEELADAPEWLSWDQVFNEKGANDEIELSKTTGD